MTHIEQKVIDRFNSHWELSGECHLWKSSLDKDGYGSFYFFKMSRRAHRFAYYMVNGEIPDGMVIDHICRNRNCVNPQHLRCITASQNAIENTLSVAAINRNKKLCKNGHPFDKKYKNQRICSICEKEKQRRLKKKWYQEGKIIKC